MENLYERMKSHGLTGRNLSTISPLLLETTSYHTTSVDIPGAKREIRSPEASSMLSSSRSCQSARSEDYTFDMRYKLSPAKLERALDFILQQVDWRKVVADVGGEGTAMLYRDAFEGICNTTINNLRDQGQTHRGKNRGGESGSEGSSCGSFIENDTDDDGSEDYSDDIGEETNGESSEQSDLYGDMGEREFGGEKLNHDEE